MNKEEIICYMERIMREYGVSRSEIADKVKSTRQYIGLLAAGQRLLTNRMLCKLENVSLYPKKLSKIILFLYLSLTIIKSSCI